MKFVLLFIIVLLFIGTNTAQVYLENTGSQYTIDFRNPVFAVNGGIYTGAGFSSGGGAGQLDSRAWASTGMSDGDLAFGGTQTTGGTDYTRGTVTFSPSGGGGFYAYTGAPASSGHPIFLIQPTTSDFTPGTVTLRIWNLSNKTINALEISYALYVNNDKGVSSSFNFSYSTDNSSYTAVPALDYTSPQNADINGLVAVGTKSTIITSLNLIHGNYFYIRWSSDEVSGSGGEHDEFGLDDIKISVPVTFTNGSSFNPPAGVPNTANNPIGRFQLTSGVSGTNFTGLTITLPGTRSGVSALYLYSSGDATFEAGDTYLAAASDGPTATFSSFTSAISTSGTYYFVVAELGPNPDGNITATIANNAAITITGARLSGTLTDVALSSGATPLPVELTSFTASSVNGTVNLNWATATEVSNYGFDVERSADKSVWNNIGFVAGNGNSNSVKSYSYSDNTASAGTVYYRLKQLDTDGKYEYSKVVSVNNTTPDAFTVDQNFPNPFNPSTTIRFSLANSSNVKVDVYASNGELVHTLANKTYEAGNHALNFDASQLSAGIYLYRITAIDAAGKIFSAVKKMQLIK